MEYCTEQQQQQQEVMEVPEIDGDMLAELLDASLAGADEEPDEATGPQLDVFDSWVESHERNSIVHPHHDCEDCGLDDGDGAILSDFELNGCGCSRSPSPSYVAFDDDDDTAQWTDTGEAVLEPFVGECMGGWYMDGMAMDWEEDEGNDFSFGPYYHGGEVNGAEQRYGSPLWE